MTPRRRFAAGACLAFSIVALVLGEGAIASTWLATVILLTHLGDEQ